MTTQNDTAWMPSKADYSDDEARNTPIYESLKNQMSVSIGGGKRIGVDESRLLEITKETIRSVWEQVSAAAFSEDIVNLFSKFSAAGIVHGNAVTIKLEDGVGSFKPVHGRKKFGHDDYATFIGGCTHPDSEAAKLAEEALKKAGYDVGKTLKGGYILNKLQAKSPVRNCVLELVLEEGDPKNVICGQFKAKLYQYALNKAKLPVISFPPASGLTAPKDPKTGKPLVREAKKKLITSDSVLEVSSMSDMMKKCLANIVATPAKAFGLVEDEDGEDFEDEDAGESHEPDARNAAADLLGE